MDKQAHVVSEKPKVQSYLSVETYQRVERLAAGESISKTVEHILDEATQDNAIVVVLSDAQVKQLKRFAAEGFRPLKDQVKMAVVEWLRHQAEQ